MKPSNFFSAAVGALSRPLQRHVAKLIYPSGTQPADFLRPPGEAALLTVDSVTWRVLANPVAALVGGITAVLMELAEPRIRSGVWEHTSFRELPLQRLQRTGYAAMMTAFGARSRAEAMIRRVNAGHARVTGHTPSGVPYSANDPELLTWVHATATFGFLRAYVACVRPLAAEERDRFFAENQEAARLYGVPVAPASEREFESLLEQMRPQFEASDIVLEFLAIMRRVPLLPAPLRGLQSMLIAAAVENLPADVRERLGLAGAEWAVARWQWRVLRMLGRAADHLNLPSLPAVLASKRLGTSPEQT